MTTKHTLTDIILLEVLDRMNMTDLPEARYNEYKAKLTPIIDDRIVGNLLENMTEGEREMFQTMSDTGSFSLDSLEILFENPDKMEQIEKELTLLVEELSRPL